MIRIIFASVFLFAISAQVSAEKINCYACYTGKLPTGKSGKPIQFKDVPPSIPACTETMQTAEVDNEQVSCVKIDVSGTFPIANTETDVEATVRYYFAKDKCGPLENLITDAGDLAGYDISASCYECDEDKCNSATSIQISFLTFLALIVSMYAVRN